MKILKFQATWCKPCQDLSRVISVMQDLPEIQVIDIDEEPDLTKQYNVRGVPTLVLLSDEGKVIDQRVGMCTTDALREFINVNAS